MFRISLKDVGENRVTKDVMADVSTFHEAELIADSECEKILGYSEFRRQEITLREYAVIHVGFPVGSFSITKLH